MQTTVLCTLYVGATMVISFASALNSDDDGVCSKTETYATSQSESFAASFVQSFETCDYIFFCNTKYRTAYRAETRTIYKKKRREYLTCCNGYVEADGGCKLKVPSTVPMASSTPSTSLLMSSLLTTVHSTVPTSPADATTLPFDMVTALPRGMSVQTMMMISGAVVLLAFIAGVVLLLWVVVTRRRRKRQLASSLENTEGNGEFIQPGGAYYSIIRSNVPDGANSSTVEISQLPHGSSSGPPTPARKKKNTFKNLSVFYAKNLKGRNKGRDTDLQSYDSGSHASDDEHGDIVHYYSDMDNMTSTQSKQPQGYIDMSSPTRTPRVTGAPATNMQEGGNEYSVMDSQGKSDDQQQYNEFEPYDKLNQPDKHPMVKKSPDASGYDHLDRTDSLIPSKGVKPVEDNPYDKVGREVPEEERGGGGKDPEPYDHLKGSIVMKKSKTNEERGRVLREDNPKQQNESMYYNTPEENALKRRKSRQDEDTIYTNVS